MASGTMHAAPTDSEAMMRSVRFLLVALSVLLVADGAGAASKHERTRSSASRKSGKKSKSGGHDGDSGLVGACLSGFFDGCLSGCVSAGCSLAGHAAGEAVDARVSSMAEPPPPAPGLEPLPLEPEPGDLPPATGPEAEGDPRRLPEHLTPMSLPEEAVAEAPEARPPWMPDTPGSPEGSAEPSEGDQAQRSRTPFVPVAPVDFRDTQEALSLAREDPSAPVEDSRGTPEALGLAWEDPSAPVEGSRGTPEVPGLVREGLSDPPEDSRETSQAFGLAREDSSDPPQDLRDTPEAFGLAPPPGPPPPAPDPGPNARLDARMAGAWIFADLPNASFDARASVGTKGMGPGLDVWYTGLWERIDGSWDHLPVGGLRLAFGFGTEAVRPTLRLGGTVLGLGDGDTLFGMDAGLALEIRLGGEGAPWLDVYGDALLYEGFTASDFGGGVSFPGGPFYVRAGVRSLYLETFYAGPELAVGLRL
jgi:hypothetical protein